MKTVEPLVTVTAVAEHFSVSVRTIRRWEQEGLPREVFSSKTIRYRLSDVGRWARRRAERTAAA